MDFDNTIKFNDDFEWNKFKNEKNIIKHKVGFEEASTVFSDDFAMIDDDKKNSTPEEERFKIIGYSAKFRLLMVAHCYRGTNDEIIRIISARPADQSEEKEYKKRKGAMGYGTTNWL